MSIKGLKKGSVKEKIDKLEGKEVKEVKKNVRKPAAQKRQEKITSAVMEIVKSFMKHNLLKIKGLSFDKLKKSISDSVKENVTPKGKKERPKDKPKKPISIYFRYTAKFGPQIREEAKETKQKYTVLLLKRYKDWKVDPSNTKEVKKFQELEKVELEKYNKELVIYKKNNNIGEKNKAKKKDGELKKMNALTCYKNHFLSENEKASHPEIVLAWSKLEPGEKGEKKDKNTKAYWANKASGFNSENGLNKKKKSDEIDEE